MFSQYFGHYLLNHGLISHTDLSQALAFQKSVHVKFGVIAVDQGFMTSVQVDEVQEEQKQMDKRFGEIALELGYLTEEQIQSLISQQKQSHLYLAQALVDLNIMTMDQFSKALSDYKQEYSLSDDQFEALRNGNIDTLIENILMKKDANLQEAYSKYLSLFAKNMIRFIDDQVYLELEENETVGQGNWVVHQEIIGEAPLFTALNLQEDALLHIASIYAEEELSEVDELAKDAVSEFLNLHNGIYLVNMSNWGTELTMQPQKITKATTISGDLLPITVKTSKGSFQLLLSSTPSTVSLQENYTLI